MFQARVAGRFDFFTERGTLIACIKVFHATRRKDIAMQSGHHAACFPGFYAGAVQQISLT